MIGKKYTIGEMKAINKDKGYCYFSKETIKFWGAKIESTYQNGLFIESIDNFNQTARQYKVGLFTFNGDVCTIDMFNNINDAKALVIGLNKAIKNFGYREQLTYNECNYVYKIENNTMYEFISDKNKDNPSYSFTIDKDFQIRG